MQSKHLLLAASLTGFLTSTAQAQFQTIAEDSFAYPSGVGLGGQAGGLGWGGVWWAGVNLDDALVTSPSLDMVGAKVTTSLENGGSFRLPDRAPWPDETDDMERFGADGAILWVSWTAQKVAGSTDAYGGFSFNEQLVAEKLFIGECYQTGLLGIDPVGAPPITIAGTDPFAQTRFVVRVEHLPGDDHLQLWLNPAVPHPMTTPDLDEMVPDLFWNEIRLQSGENGGGLTGYNFDDLLIETELTGAQVIGSNYCGPAVPNSIGLSGRIEATGSKVAGGNPLNLRGYDLPPNQFGFFIGSMGQGFIPNPSGSMGNLCVVGAIARFNMPVQNSGTLGEFDLDVDTLNIPLNPSVAIQAGEPWYFQAWHRDWITGQGATSNFTDAVAILFN